MHLLFDIGGTNTRVSVTEDGETFREPVVYPTPREFEDGMRRLWEAVLDESGGVKTFEKIVGGFPGPLDTEKASLLNAPNLPGWVGKPLKPSLEEMFSAEVLLENDAAQVGLGEAVYGAGKGKRIVAYLTISTGIGGARIVEGNIDTASIGFEPGHQIIGLEGKKPVYLEKLASGKALQERHGIHPREITDTRIWDEVTRYVGICVHNTILYWSPDIIVLGGSVMQSLNIKAVTSYLDTCLYLLPTRPDIVHSELGDYGGLYGGLVRLKKF